MVFCTAIDAIFPKGIPTERMKSAKSVGNYVVKPHKDIVLEAIVLFMRYLNFGSLYLNSSY